MLDKVVIESLAARIRREFEFQLEKFGEVLSNLPLWTCAAALAYHGLLGPVNATWLDRNYFDFDRVTIPVQHRTALVSCVTGIVNICHFNDCDLVTGSGQWRDSGQWTPTPEPGAENRDQWSPDRVTQPVRHHQGHLKIMWCWCRCP